MKAINNKPKISVIIPVYNGEKYLKQTTNYLKKQTFSNFEIIFVDDGSNDATSSILEKFQKETTLPVTIITQNNKGPGAARNAGLGQAKGEYLALLDADDHFEPSLLEKLYRRAVSTKADVVVCRADEFWPQLDRTVETPWTINAHLLPKGKNVFSSKDIPRNFFEVFVGWTWDKLFRTDYINKTKLKFQELRSSDDAFFCFMALIHAQKLTVIEDVLVHHIKYSPVGDDAQKQSVSNSRESSWNNFYQALIAMKQQMKKWGIYKRFEQDYINYFLNFSLWHLTTLTGSAYFQLFGRLKGSWFNEEIGKNRSPEFFYSEYHYNLYTHLMRMNAENFLFHIKQQAEQRCSDLEWHNHNLHHDLETRDQNIRQLEADIKVLSDRIHELEKEITDIRRSTAWKVGRVTTALPRKTKQLLKAILAKATQKLQ